MARGRNNSTLNRARFSASPAASVQVVSQGTVSKPKPIRVGKHRKAAKPNLRIVQAPGQSGTI
jgi:outer membrane lipoprotein SlyB